jgi:DnaJ-class molecular chaperone
MASDDSDGSDSEDQAPASHGPRECMACRGSGQVISNLGGTPSTLTCPWCEGGGVRVADINAQTKWLEQRATAGESAEAVEVAAAPESAA